MSTWGFQKLKEYLSKLVTSFRKTSQKNVFVIATIWISKSVVSTLPFLSAQICVYAKDSLLLL